MNGVVDENVSIVFCLTLTCRPNTKTTINTKQRPKIERVRTSRIHSQFNCDPINSKFRTDQLVFDFVFILRKMNWKTTIEIMPPTQISSKDSIYCIMRWVVECGMSLGLNYAFIASYSSHSNDLSSLFYSMKISKKINDEHSFIVPECPVCSIIILILCRAYVRLLLFVANWKKKNRSEKRKLLNLLFFFNFLATLLVELSSNWMTTENARSSIQIQ